MQPGLRDRSGSSLSFQGSIYSENSDKTGGHNTIINEVDTYEIIDAQHSGWESSTGDAGGPFFLKKVNHVVSPFNVNVHWASGAISYRGPVYPKWTNADMSVSNVNANSMSDADLDSVGTTLLSRAIPTNPTFSLATFLGESLQPGGIPRITGLKLIRERARLLRNSGDEYLNVEFGWLPLMSDVRSFAYAVKNSHRILSEYKKHSGTKIRRRKALPSSSGTTSVENRCLANSQWFSGWATTSTATRAVESSTWFSGAFKYFLPVPDSLDRKMALWRAEADKLLGVSLTPSTLWELAPWSWAVDWFSNTGDVINSISKLGSDGLVMQYGYVMHKVDDFSTMMQRYNWWDYQGRITHLNDGPAFHTIRTQYKQRRPATPYGFGIDLNSLSTTQISILAALGLSRT